MSPASASPSPPPAWSSQLRLEASPWELSLLRSGPGVPWGTVTSVVLILVLGEEQCEGSEVRGRSLARPEVMVRPPQPDNIGEPGSSRAPSKWKMPANKTLNTFVKELARIKTVWIGERAFLLSKVWANIFFWPESVLKSVITCQQFYCIFHGNLMDGVKNIMHAQNE